MWLLESKKARQTKSYKEQRAKVAKHISNHKVALPPPPPPSLPPPPPPSPSLPPLGIATAAPLPSKLPSVEKEQLLLYHVALAQKKHRSNLKVAQERSKHPPPLPLPLPSSSSLSREGHAEIGRAIVRAIQNAKKNGMPSNNRGGVSTINSVDTLDVGVDTQMRRWKANGEQHCNTLWGWGSSELWRRGAVDLCKPYAIPTTPNLVKSSSLPPSSPLFSSSKVTSYHRKMHFHAVPDTFVMAENVSMTLSDLSIDLNEKTAKWSVNYAEEKGHSHKPVLLPAPGSLRADCEINTYAGWPRFNQIKNWFGSGPGKLGGVLTKTKKENFECKEENKINHTIMITSRHGHANMFHSHEDMLNAWIVLGALNQPLRGLQHYFTDGYPKEPLLAVWQHLLGDPTLPVLGGYELGKMFRDGKFACYRRIIWNMPGIASPWATGIGTKTACRGCPLFQSYAYSLMSRLGSANLNSQTYPRYPPPPVPSTSSSGAGKRKLVVTWISRQKMEHPSATFCDDEFFPCRLHKNKPIRQLGRILRNEAALVLEIQEKYADILTISTPKLPQMPILEQLRYFSGTDLMIGPHGAGLTYILFTPDNAGLLELFIDGSSSNMHFHNAARFAKKKYWSLASPNPLPLATLSPTLEKVWRNPSSGL